MVVMVSGRAGEGKTTFSNMCIEYLESLGYTGVIVPFARGVKDTAKFMGWDGKKDDRGRKLLQSVGNAGRDYYEDIWASKTVGSIKKLRSGGYGDIREASVFFIDDWRFMNEGDVISNKFPNTLKIRIHRPREYHTLYRTHLYNDISETSLPEMHENFIPFTGGNPSREEIESWTSHNQSVARQFYDEIIYNTKSLDRLRELAQAFVNDKILPTLEEEKNEKLSRKRI